jgi:cytoskeleton protein RodZ
MGIKQVRALEENDYVALPTGTFLRGFVRNFAKEVGVNPESALALLERTHVAAVPISASSVVVPSQQNISVPTPGGDIATPRTRLVIVVVIGLLLLIVVWWWWEYVRPYLAEGGRPKADNVEKTVSLPTIVPAPVPLETPRDVVAAPAGVSASPEQAQPASVQTSAPPTPVQPAQATSAAQAPVLKSAISTTVVSPPSPALPVVKSDVAAKAQAQLTSGSGMLGLTFSDKSWVQVLDANGKVVVDKIFRGGEAEEVTGKAPFAVIIGNAPATRLAFNGKEIDLEPHTRSSVARVTVK